MSQTIWDKVTKEALQRLAASITAHNAILHELNLKWEPRCALRPGTPPMLEQEWPDDEDDY